MCHILQVSDLLLEASRREENPFSMHSAHNWTPHSNWTLPVLNSVQRLITPIIYPLATPQ